MHSTGPFEERPFPSHRNPTVDTLRWGRRKHHVPVLLEIDVTDARARFHAMPEAARLSFTGWVVACLARAVAEHPHVQALRRGRRRLVVFSEVDVAVVVERAVGAGETLPMPYVVRRANEKDAWAIHHEIRAAQAQPIEAGAAHLEASRERRALRTFARLPTFLRDLFWRRLEDPFFFKRTLGTVGLTSVAARGASSSWAVPVGLHPLVVSLTGVARKPAVVGDEIVARDLLGVTVLFDHEVTDGMPVMRFLERLRQLMEGASGLPSPEP